MAHVIEKFAVGGRRACELLDVDRTHRYISPTSGSDGGTAETVTGFWRESVRVLAIVGCGTKARKWSDQPETSPAAVSGSGIESAAARSKAIQNGCYGKADANSNTENHSSPW